MTKSTRGQKYVDFDLLMGVAEQLHAFAHQEILPRQMEVLWEKKTIDGTWVSDLDRLAGARTAEITECVVPGSTVIDEERPESHTADLMGACRVIDGLDGSSVLKSGKRVNGITFSTSVTTWLFDGKPQATVVIQPAYFRRIVAVRGQGIRIRDGLSAWKPLRVWHKAQRPHPLVGLVISSDEAVREMHRKRIAAFREAYTDVGNPPTVHAGVKVTLGEWAGCANISRCKVWDLASTALAMHETGGYVRRQSGGEVRLDQIDMRAHEDPIIIAQSTALGEDIRRTLDCGV